jgi:hypothetical protein
LLELWKGRWPPSVAEPFDYIAQVGRIEHRWASPDSVSSSRRAALGVGIPRRELARLAVSFGLGLVAAPATRYEVGGGGGPLHSVGLDVVVLGRKALAAVGATDAIEVGWIAELEGDEDLDRDVAGPAAQVSQVHPVVEHPGEEGIGGDIPGDLGS